MWEISLDMLLGREMKGPRPGYWAPDTKEGFELIPENVRATMPDPGDDWLRWVGLMAGGEEYAWVIESLAARRRLPPARSFRPIGPA